MDTFADQNIINNIPDTTPPKIIDGAMGAVVTDAAKNKIVLTMTEGIKDIAGVIKATNNLGIFKVKMKQATDYMQTPPTEYDFVNNPITDIEIVNNKINLTIEKAVDYLFELKLTYDKPSDKAIRISDNASGQVNYLEDFADKIITNNVSDISLKYIKNQ